MKLNSKQKHNHRRSGSCSFKSRSNGNDLAREPQMVGGYFENHGYPSEAAGDGNAIVASLNRKAFNRSGVLSINLVGGPGAGKTTLILQTIARLLPDLRSGVIAA